MILCVSINENTLVTYVSMIIDEYADWWEGEQFVRAVMRAIRGE